MDVWILESAQAVADSIGGVVVPIDALAKDYIKNLDAVASRIENALSSQSPHPSSE